MKIAIGYPPLEGEKGIPQISQNRQFQWTTPGPVAYFIYPVVPAYAATLLRENGYEVVWLDGLAEKWSYKRWLEELKKEDPDLIAIETKTPVIKMHWKTVSDLKKEFPKMQVVLLGDHVTALPEESMENCPLDFIITGGDYDFLLLNLANFLTKGEKLEPGIWYREESKVNPLKKYGSTGKFQLNHDLNNLPLIDRDLTKWRLYAYKNSNFYRAPGAYTMFSRDCWWGRCTFCSWTTLYPGSCYRVVNVEKALDEVGQLIEKYGVREIMDDSGTFPIGRWLREFCKGMIKRGYNKKVRINCNMRFNAELKEEDYQLMGKAGFRFILYGLESANQETLDRLNKNLKVEQIEPVLRVAKRAGLWPHITVMVGYPWEGREAIKKTVDFVENLFQRGLVDSMQATIVIPYPGTPLFEECKREGLLKTLDWNRYDMREPVMKTPVSDKELLATVRKLYSSSIWNKTFLANTMSQLKNIDGIKYVSFQAFKYLGKLLEFKNVD